MAPKRKNDQGEQVKSEENEKKNHEDASSSEDDVGPALPSEAPAKKKRRTLPFESLFLDALPRGTRYSRSLMHKDQLSFVTFTPKTDFLITASIDGQVNFWKKLGSGQHVEFVKEFKAHDGEVTGVACTYDGKSYASCGKDGTVKIWNVILFDLFAVLNVEKTPSCIQWVYGPKTNFPLLAVGNETDGDIAVFNSEGEPHPLFTLTKVHKKPVTCMAYHPYWNCVVSADETGMIEYWQPTTEAETPEGLFKFKSATHLYDLRKTKQYPSSLTLSPTGKQFATYSFPDRKVRIFHFETGKLYRVYDESIPTITQMQQAGTAAVKIDNSEFEKRLAVERDLENTRAKKRINVIFDSSGNFVLFGSVYGTKLVNTLTNKVRKVYGAQEHFRCLNLALYQGQPEQKEYVTLQMAASDNPLLKEAEAYDPMLVSTGPTRVRFYMFTNDEDVDKSTRDVHNEKPRVINPSIPKPEVKKAQTGNYAILYTTKGDIHIELFPNKAPKAVENFVTHSRNNYYNDVLFHRVIPKFMIQTGDPKGDGTGGESIWGKEFADEISDLKHDDSYVVSMANAGPNTNASQFFITTHRAPWLDGKHTVFGRAVRGFEAIHSIENARRNRKTEKPEVDIKIVSITIKE